MALVDSNYDTIQVIVHGPTIYDSDIDRWWFLIFLVIGISLISTIGDLALSFLKSEYLIKNYATLFKNHGGVLDRFDS